MTVTPGNNIKSPITRLFHAEGLRRRLLMTLSVIFLTSLLIIGAGVYFFISQIEQNSWQEREQEAATVAADTVSAFMQNTLASVRLTGDLQPDQLADNPEMLNHLLGQNSALLELVRIDSTGRVFASTYRDAPLLANLFTIPQSRWFLESRAGKTYLGNVQISPDGEPYLIISQPATDSGVVVARLGLNRLWDVLSKLGFGKTGQAYVFNANGEIIGHSADPAVAISKTSLDARPEIAAIMQSPNFEWQGKYTNFQGQRILGVSTPVNGTDWIIVTEVTQSEATATSQVALGMLVGVLVFSGALVLLLTTRFLNNLILEPMSQLQAGAERIGRGDLDYRIAVDPARRDEVSGVARAFNSMSDQLRSRDQTIQQQTRTLEESEARFRRVVESISDHIYMSEITAAGEHKNIFLSPHVEKLTGYPIENFERDWEFWPRHVIYPDDHAVTKTQLERLLNGQDSQAEYRLKRADGSLIWIRDSARVEKNTKTGSLIIFGVVSDISEQKVTQRALEKQREFLQQVIDINPHFIFAKNGAGQFTLANLAFARAYGTTVAELIGKTDADFNPNKELVEYYDQADMRVIETGQELTIPADRVVNIHGQEVWRYTIKRPLFDETGQVTQVLGVATDITHLKRAEEAIARARDEAVQANEFKTRLLANVSHDLRTPLNAILGYSEMLQYGVYGALTPQQEQTVKTIIASIEALTHMVNQLLDQARLEARAVTLSAGSFRPQTMVDQVEQTMRVLAQNKGLTLSTEVDPNLPATLTGDADRIQQILNNLVGNAIKFTGQGKVCVQIFATDTQNWAMEVSDTGPGIPAAAQSLIFEPFQQVDGSITREHTGSGLGLSIVKQLTTLMDGQILLQSREGHGSTFTVLLPLTPAQEKSE